MEVTWRGIPSCENSYRVSDTGKVYSLLTDRIMKSWIQPNGYESVYLRINGHYKTFTMHRLVMLAFVSERPAGMDINHKDGNRLNNHLSNLEYITHQQNIDHASDVLGWSINGTKNPLAKLDDDKVREIRRLYSQGATIRGLAKVFGVTPSAIQSVVRRETWKHVDPEGGAS